MREAGVTVRTRLFSRFAVCAFVLLNVSSRALGTWSILLMDTRTREISVGAATCVPDIDLKSHLPVLLVDRAAACAQARVDVSGANRLLIYQRLVGDVPPDAILQELAGVDDMHATRQYGMVTDDGAAATFTGSQTFDFAGGVTGSAGDVVYAIQGNILTGEAVVAAAEQAVVNTAGGLPEKLMAAMEAARAMGGDGRCSCPDDEPTGCGAPPPEFEKSAHVGFMTGTRTGDTDGGCDAAGCATGLYFMDFNVANKGAADPDPVVQLRDAFDAWRASLVDAPDAVVSSVDLSPTSFLADGAGNAVMTVTLRDYAGDSLSVGQLAETELSVEHAADSDRTTGIGAVVEVGGGAFQVKLSGSDRIGRDRYLVRATGPFRPVTMVPVPELLSLAHADHDRDGDVDRGDVAYFVGCLSGPMGAGKGPCDAADFDGNGVSDLTDFAVLQRQYTDAGCVELRVVEAPQSAAIPCGFALTLDVTVSADPPAVFQWFLNGEPIPGAVRSQYRVSSTTADDYGTYSVRIQNTCGTLVVDGVEVVERGIPCP